MFLGGLIAPLQELLTGYCELLLRLLSNGGRYVIRTRDPSRVKGVLYH
jgi:hypothetical protein